MKQSILLILTAVLVLQGCSKNTDGDDIPRCDDCEFTCIDNDNTKEVLTNACLDNWTCQFEMLANSKINTEAGLGVEDGGNTVFQLTASTEGDLAIADDEFTRILIFELDSSQESFSIDDATLSEMNVHYKLICYCPDVKFNPAVSGCQQGEKQGDDTWLVQGNLTFDDVNFGNPVDVLVDAQFE